MTDARSRAVAFAGELAEQCADRLGAAMVAGILHGSLTLGDFAPRRSDIDLFVIVEDRLSAQQFAAVHDALDQLTTDAPRRVDLRVVTRATAARPTLAPVLEAGFVLRPSMEVELEARVAHEPDVAVEFSVARAHGRSLLGPAPEAIVGAVPADWLVEIGDRRLAAWERLTDDADHAELIVLTACRIWRFAAERLHCPKTAAARWAFARDPSLNAVDEALRRRTSDPAVAIGANGIAHLLALVRRELRIHSPTPS